MGIISLLKPSMEMKMYYVYIVLCADSTLYTGIAKDLNRRIEEHNTSDKGAKYTKSRRPVTLIYHEEHEDRSAASKREYAIKKMRRDKKQCLITSHNIH